MIKQQNVTLNILRSGMDRTSLSNNLSHSILNISQGAKGGLVSLNSAEGSTLQNSNSTMLTKLRKTPTDFHLASFLVQNNMSQMPSIDTMPLASQ
jgi:hypothetical protein